MKKLFTEIPRLEGERVTLGPLTPSDAPGLLELTQDETVYRYLPTFLYETRYEDKEYVISRLYDECISESMILGVFFEGDFCGLAEVYGYRPDSAKASVGYRLLKRYRGKGIATETLGLLVKYLFGETDVKIITASTMLENSASANVLKKNGFTHVAHAAPEDWGYPLPTLTDKWLRASSGAMNYRFGE